MAYDEELAHRLREAMSGADDIEEKRAFGGLMLLAGGNMAVAALARGELMVRCRPEQTAELVTNPGVVRMEMRGREMDGWLLVDASAVESDASLAHWVGIGLAQARSLPPK